MLFGLECGSVAVYGVSILACFVFGLARGKPVRKANSHIIFFFFLYMIALCFLDMYSSWGRIRESDGFHVDMIRFAKSLGFTGVFTLIVTNMISGFSIFTLIHGATLAFTYFALYMSMIEHTYSERVGWLVAYSATNAVRLFYLLKEIVDGKHYNPVVLKTVTLFNILYNAIYFVAFVMSDYFQGLISVYTMNVIMSTVDLILVPLCTFIISHFGWSAIRHLIDDRDPNNKTAIASNASIAQAYKNGTMTKEELRILYHTHY